MALPSKTTTIEDFIESGKGVTITYSNLSFLDHMNSDIYVAVLNVVNSYMDEIMDYAVTVELTKKQQDIYYYKPKLLCYDIYGNPESYFIILLMNDMADVKEFCKPKIKMLRKDNMSSIVSAIYNAEKTAIGLYNKK